MDIKESAAYQSRITDWPSSERPREKLVASGPQHLSEAELIAILIRTGTHRQTAVDIARDILSRVTDLHELAAMDHEELCRLNGIGPAKAIALNAAFELGRRIASVPLGNALKITDPEIVFRRYEPLLSHLKKEVFLILILNSANILIRDVQISEGILNSSLVHPREVFRSAILASAASIILLHNHPSGEIQPSEEDRHITRRLVDAGLLLNVPIVDHVIIGRKRYFSFREGGLL